MARSKFQKIFVRLLWLGFFLAIISVIIVFVAVSFSKLPDLVELENPKYELASPVYSDDNRELGRYYVYNRVPLKYTEISPSVVEALLATEDIRFHNHAGIDLKGTARALAFLGKRGGASTITQQLAKQLFTGQRSSNIVHRIWQKLKEWYISIQMEKRYTKEEIIAMYLNKFDFVNDAVGLQAAAETYFEKDQSELNVEEAAVLVGMFKNPVLFNPKSSGQNALKRRGVILDQMAKYDYLSGTQKDSLKETPLGLRFSRSNQSAGVAPYFRAELTKYLRNLLRQKEYFKPDGTPYNIYTDGLKVYTTIDYDMQVIAEEEMSKHMANVQKTYFKRWKGMDPWSYDANFEQKKIRQKSLTNLIRFSDRYISMRNSALSDDLSTMSKKFTETKFRDIDIERMIEQEGNKQHLRKLVARDIITKKMAANYERVMASDEWINLRDNWKNLQEKVEVAFDKTVKMKVFSHEEGEKVVEMSPLDSIKYHRQHMQFGSLSIEPSTGHIKAWVGGIDHKYFKYDHINSSRQVGSTFKPFIYATAISMKGMSPCQQIKDIPVTIAQGDGAFQLAKPWTPSNSDGEYTGEYFDMYRGLKKSKNTVSVYLMKELGNAQIVRDLVGAMGIRVDEVRSDGEFRVPNQPSICLGAADLSVMEMAGAYTTFANNGVYSEPLFVTRITDKNDRVIYQAVEKESVALSPQNNYVMVDLLTKAVAGTTGEMKSIAGGKTGTTNDYVDGWFMGFTPDLVVGTWVGGEDPWIRFRSLADGQGSRMAKPFFRSYMKRLETDPDIDFEVKSKFYKPSGDIGIELDCEKYQKYIGEPEEDDLKNQMEDDLESELEDDLELELDDN